jgi:hypothetical protein
MNDFKIDQGQNKMAKTFQTICLALIVLHTATSVRYFGWLFRHFDKAQEKYTSDVGIIPGEVHFLIFVSNILLLLSVLIIAFFLANRNLKARKLLFYFLPALALTETFNVYRGWLSDGDDAGFNHGIIFLIGFVIFGTISSGILLLYNTKFMKDFFNYKNVSPAENKVDGHMDT